MKDNSKFTPKKKRFVDNIVEFMSFSQEVRQLVEILNTEIAAPDTVVFRPISHPAGFSRLITKRRLTIAESYIRLISHSQGSNYIERIEALQVLVHHIWHSKNVSMPINTARVQIALMKNAVKQRGNRRAQLELMSDFARASFGQPTVIRRLLRDLDLIEVPECGANLSDMTLGWDDHVHDSMTEGRKSPSHLVLDAFIKGISHITVAYYDAAHRETYEEIFLAAQILGVRVQIGIEFSVGKKYDRLHYLYIPPNQDDFVSLSRFLDDNADKLKSFWDGLKQNSLRRHETVCALLDSFNNSGLARFNEEYSELNALKMSPLSWESVESMTTKGQANRIHLGQLIYQAMRPVALKRVLYLKNLYRTLFRRAQHDASSSWEAERCLQRYEIELKKYEELTPAKCEELYITPQHQLDYDSAFADENDVFPVLRDCGGRIVFIHPISRGLQSAVDVIFVHYQMLTDVEVFNLVDALKRDTIEIRRFASLLMALHQGNTDQVENQIREWRLKSIDSEKIRNAAAWFKDHPLFMRCASDAVGWSSNIPGMGFIHESSLTPKSLRVFRKIGHVVVPRPVAELLQMQDHISDASKQDIYLMSSTKLIPSEVKSDDSVSLFRFWHYLNTDIRCLILAVIGFIPTVYCLGWGFAILWFLLTGFRNAIVDLIASAGLIPRGWNFKSIDRENLCASEFFSGFSVPVLALAKLSFDQTWAYFALPDGFWFTFVKFWAIAFANGLYLVLHNTLRGFEKSVIRGNFFRNVISWPLATLASYVLTPLGVPDIVQAKIWSEVVAGFIEGTGKSIRQNRLARKAMLEVYGQLLSPNPLYALIARLDILFFWGRYSQGRRALKRYLMLPNHPARELSETQTQNVLKANALIVKAFTTEGSLESLTYAILEYYPEENLTILTDFVGELHAPFVEWLAQFDSN